MFGMFLPLKMCSFLPKLCPNDSPRRPPLGRRMDRAGHEKMTHLLHMRDSAPPRGRVDCIQRGSRPDPPSRTGGRRTRHKEGSPCCPVDRTVPTTGVGATDPVPIGRGSRRARTSSGRPRSAISSITMRSIRRWSGSIAAWGPCPPRDEPQPHERERRSEIACGALVIPGEGGRRARWAERRPRCSSPPASYTHGFLSVL